MKNSQRRSNFLSYILIVLSFFFAFSSQASNQRQPAKIQISKNFNDAKIYLVTIGLGTALHTRYGHTLLRFVDGDTGASYMYNWGMFSFDDPLFPLKFFLGERLYWVGEANLGTIIRYHRDIDDRNVFEQELNLTPRQKKRLIEVVNSQLSPEKMFFRYEHFTSNCATKPRDFIDEALGGYVFQKLNRPVLPEITYRDYVRRNMNMPSYLGFVLDVVMSSDLEKKLSKWDEAFYPLKLSEHLSSLPAIGDNGEPDPDRRLLGQVNSLVDASSEHNSGDFLFIIPFSLTFLSIFIFLSLWYRFRGTSNRIFNFLFGLSSLVWGGFSGLIGLTMILSWFVSTHYDMHHNANLLVFFPTDLLYARFGWKVMFYRKLGAYDWKILKFSNYLHFVLCVLFIILNSSGYLLQNTTRVLYFLVPVMVVYLFVIERFRMSNQSKLLV